MDAPLRSPMTVEQFLAWEAGQEERHEFDGFGPVAMAGGTAVHAVIQVNLLAALSNCLRGRPCRAYGSKLKILVAGRIRYPDAFVACTPVAANQTALSEPVVVFEVLSDGTSNEDLVVKNAEYRATASIQRYVVLQRDEPGALVFSRKGRRSASKSRSRRSMPTCAREWGDLKGLLSPRPGARWRRSRRSGAARPRRV